MLKCLHNLSFPEHIAHDNKIIIKKRVLIEKISIIISKTF